MNVKKLQFNAQLLWLVMSFNLLSLLYVMNSFSKKRWDVVLDVLSIIQARGSIRA